MINPIVKTIELPDGRTITLETGKLAKQADGSVMLRMGNTMLLATVCAAKDAVPGTDFMPLQVEYKEKFAAFGRFPGGFTKREGRASDYEILTCRLVDRALRPLFPDNYHAEVYVNIILFSADGVDMPDALAGLAASAALAVSDIPFNGPISEVRVARIDGQFVINPTFEQLEKADMDLMVAATYENIMMVEGEMHEVSEAELLEAMKVAHEAIKVHCKAQMELTEEVGKTVKREYNHEVNDEDLRKAVREACYEKAYAVAASGNNNKHERFAAFEAIREEFKAQFSEEELDEKGALIDRYYHDVEKEAMRRSILDEGKRLDGRKTTEIRPIWCEVGPLPGPHGSAIFTRGETQSLTSVTLGTKLDEKIIDDVLEHGKERFLLHYNFPPFSTGEAKAQRGVGRREIGHGHLAWRALKGQIPADYPYVVRVVSDILESNGSSSMATVCAGTLALMDAGVKLKIISNYAVGYDNIDIPYATQKGIQVTNTPDPVTEPTADQAMGLLLAVSRRISELDRRLRVGEVKVGLLENLGHSLYGGTIGIIGMGRIGQALARRAVVAGMKIVYCNRHRVAETIEDKYKAVYLSLDELLRVSDVVSVNAPYTTETYHLIGERELSLMKPTSILINTARGPLVDEKALVKALREKVIWGAGLDVFEFGDYPSEELLSMDNVVLNPHTGTQTFEVRNEMAAFVSRNIIHFFEGGPVAKVNHID
mgnify:FL=1